MWNYIYTLSCIHAQFDYGFCVVENNGCVIVYLLWETSIEHPTSFVEASQRGEAQRAEHWDLVFCTAILEKKLVFCTSKIPASFQRS